MSAETEALLRDEDELVDSGGLLGGGREVAGFGKEDSSHLVKLRGRHDQLVEVVLRVVFETVRRLADEVASAVEDGVVAHDCRELWLPLLRPLGEASGRRGGGRRRSGKAASAQPLPELGALVA